MYLYLNTHFNDEETMVIHSYCDEYKTELSVLYSVNSELFEESDIVPSRIICIGGYYLLEEKNNEGKWNMGQRHNNKLSFWGEYGSLEKALYSL